MADLERARPPTSVSGVDLGDTGLSFVAMGRNKKAVDGTSTSPWLVGVTRSLGGGASAHFEHGNSDDRHKRKDESRTACRFLTLKLKNLFIKKRGVFTPRFFCTCVMNGTLPNHLGSRANMVPSSELHSSCHIWKAHSNLQRERSLFVRMTTFNSPAMGRILVTPQM